MSSEESFSALLKDFAQAIEAEAADAQGALAATLTGYGTKVMLLSVAIVDGEITPTEAVTAAQAYTDAAMLAATTEARALRAAALKRTTDFALRALAVAAAA